jgi:uncharacterized protein
MRDSMIKIIRQSEYKEGRWRNGQGLSWEIAAKREEGAEDFAWRFAKARIDQDVPFSIYPGMDRIFMMLEGAGMDLQFEGGKILQVHENWVPHAFSCDVPLICKLRGGPSTDLNLFVDRKKHSTVCEIRTLKQNELLKFASGQTVVFMLAGECVVGDNKFMTGDSIIFDEDCSIRSSALSSTIFIGQIRNSTEEV